jgi:hypothetical protein
LPAIPLAGGVEVLVLAASEASEASEELEVLELAQDELGNLLGQNKTYSNQWSRGRLFHYLDSCHKWFYLPTYSSNN